MNPFFSMNLISRNVLIVVLFFLLFVLIFPGTFFGSQSKDYENVDTSGEMILARLSRAMAELNALKAQNEELRSLIQNYIPMDFKSHDQLSRSSNIRETAIFSTQGDSGPEAELELTRRRLNTGINELWNYLRLNSNSSTVLSYVGVLKNSLLYDLDIISKRDDQWRRAQLKQLSNLIQEKLTQLQNPDNCHEARKIVCNLNKGCGFGCQIHHLVYCTIVAMATKRTLIINSKNWRYAGKHSPKLFQSHSLWDLAFNPVSESCLDESGYPRGHWGSPSDMEGLRVVDLPIIDSLRPRPDYLPLAIPEEIAPQLVKLHGAPIVWFIGQILKFLMKPSPDVEDFIAKHREKFDFKSPIVGVHVRRTDKINTEAAYHSLAEYMLHVEEYFDRVDLFNERQNKPKVKRIVYLATDDAKVWKNEVQKFEQKGYKFIGDYEIANTATVSRRYSFESLKNIILDIWLLSESDFLVCTFSSQVCRLAYEFMQAKNSEMDKSADFVSLDDIYYFGGQSSHNQVAILSHQAKSKKEINLSIGDVIGTAGNHWNGYSKGVNRETKENGLYPSFKTIEKIDTAEFELFKT